MLKSVYCGVTNILMEWLIFVGFILFIYGFFKFMLDREKGLVIMGAGIVLPSVPVIFSYLLAAWTGIVVNCHG